VTPFGLSGRAVSPTARAVFALLAFVLLALAIASRPTKRLNDFDQSFYTTIAYDLDRHGVFSNGMFDGVDSTSAMLPPGMFFAPLYPVLVLATTKVDVRFAAAFSCAVEANHGKRKGEECEIYALPIHILHAALLAAAVLAIATAAEIIVGCAAAFYLAGLFATAGFAMEAELFSYIMTESLTVALFSILLLVALLAARSGAARYWVLSGVTLGLLCLTRGSYLVLAIALPALALIGRQRLFGSPMRFGFQQLSAFAFGLALIVMPWLARNAISIGQFRFAEEYGSAALVERFAYNSMTPSEFALAFPYCVPALGPVVVDNLFGPETMRRFNWAREGGFFASGRKHRLALVEQHGRLDPVIGKIVQAELGENWWRYLLVSLPIAWCGMWVAGIWSLIALPLFAFVLMQSYRQRNPVLLLYGAPAIVMLGLHAAVANHYSRYNLGLVGPLSVAAAMVVLEFLTRRARLRGTR
jgi:hypothetical protein